MDVDGEALPRVAVVSTTAADGARLQTELEFVLCLANPRYINCAPLHPPRPPRPSGCDSGTLQANGV